MHPGQTDVHPQQAPVVPWRPPRAHRDRSLYWILGIVVALIFVLWVIQWYASVIDAPVLFKLTLVALIPLIGVLVAVRWIDRWEPEPWGAWIFALLWGGAVSIALTLGLENFLAIEDNVSEIAMVTVVAPIVEEFAKGLGILVLVLIGRSQFDGPLDGVVYGATIGAGFAFTENIQYFAGSYLDGGDAGLAQLFVLRGVMSPLAHPMFTMLTGIALGVAASRGAKWSLLLWFCGGLIVAADLHSLWNTSSVADFGAAYLALQVPNLIGASVLIVLLRKHELRALGKALGDYAQAGWLTPDEVLSYSSPAGRRASMRWARANGRAAKMRTLIRAATRLGKNRQLLVTNSHNRHLSDEHVLLHEFARDREATIG
ncbi:MAG TPA: PrsW family intramembrane metalloprotease [Candidatus Lumbricidophila sp.]|nr:PrsW family intramembrane metalloprotease [Candidatus Lumbricidophila sp.]